MDWTYNGETIKEYIWLDTYVGFVYLIKHIPSGKAYIGKKLFRFKKTKQVKGKKKRTTIESDWKKYYSSSEELKQDVKLLGEENFSREIIHLCKSKGMCNYLELREQMDRRVLESDLWYNSYVGSKIHRSHIKL